MSQNDHSIRVRSVSRKQTDLKKLGRVLVEFAQAQAEADAQAAHRPKQAALNQDQDQPVTAPPKEAA